MLDAISTLIRTFLSICRFRLAPQDLPSSNFLLRTTLIIYLLIAFVLSSAWLPPGPALLIAFTDTAFMVAFTLVALRVFNLNVRTTQTLTAQAGTGAILVALSLPLLAWQSSSTVAPEQIDVAAILRYLLLAWSLLVQGHIFRHTFSTNWTAGVVLALLEYWMQLTLLNAVLRSLMHP